MFLFRRLRRKRIARRPFPAEWLAIIQRNVPFYNCLSPQDKEELQRHILIFLVEKRFEGCGGLTITDEIKLTIAAQACTLLLHRRTDYYPHLPSILVYPSAYVARQVHHVGSGVLVEGMEARLGESWHRGNVVLSWDDVRRSAADIHDGHNVVFHEFAHQLDSTGAKRDSTPVLKSTSTYIAWARTLNNEYEKFCRQLMHGRRTLMNEYGATNFAEFFAVATEYFFEKPKQMRRQHPRLYNELQLFYQQNPAEFIS